MGISSKLSWVVDEGNISARKVAWLRYVMVRLMCPSACHNEIHTMHQNTGLQSANAKPLIIPKRGSVFINCFFKKLKLSMSVPESSEDLAFRPGQSWRSEWREKTLPIPVRETGQRTEFFVKGQKWHHFHHHFTKNLTKKNSIAWNLLESLVTNQACQLSTVTNLCLSRWVGQMPSSVMLPASRYQGPKDPSCFNDSTKWRYMEDLCISLQIWIERFSLRAELVSFQPWYSAS